MDNPRFLSLTLTAADPAASLLLEKTLLPRFFSSGDSASESDGSDESSLLLGSKEDILVPIMLDLRNLPLEATGIVCGVASRLAEATHNTSTGTGTDTGTGTASSSSTSIALSSQPTSQTHSSSFDSYNYIKTVFSSSANSSFNTSNSTGNGGPIKSPHNDNNNRSSYISSTYHLHHLQPDLDASTNTPVEISFLSTARAGTILVGEYELRRAVDALEAESRREDDGGNGGDGED